jgi:hypothetical protein
VEAETEEVEHLQLILQDPKATHDERTAAREAQRVLRHGGWLPSAYQQVLMQYLARQQQQDKYGK